MRTPLRWYSIIIAIQEYGHVAIVCRRRLERCIKPSLHCKAMLKWWVRMNNERFPLTFLIPLLPGSDAQCKDSLDGVERMDVQMASKIFLMIRLCFHCGGNHECERRKKLCEID